MTPVSVRAPSGIPETVGGLLVHAVAPRHTHQYPATPIAPAGHTDPRTLIGVTHQENASTYGGPVRGAVEAEL